MRLRPPWRHRRPAQLLRERAQAFSLARAVDGYAHLLFGPIEPALAGAA